MAGAEVGIDGGRVLPAIKSRKSELEQGAEPVEGTSDRGQHCVSLPDSQVNHNWKIHDKGFSNINFLGKYLVSQVERSKWRSESDKTVKSGGKSSVICNGKGVVGSNKAIDKTLQFVEESNKLTGTKTIFEKQVLRTRTVVLDTLKKSTTLRIVNSEIHISWKSVTVRVRHVVQIINLEVS